MGKSRRRRTRRQRAPAPPPPEIFSAEALDRAFVPEFDVLVARDLHTARRAYAVLAGFLRALIVDPRVTRLFADWFAQLADDPDALNTDNALPFVTGTLGLRWPWCFAAILETFHRMVMLKTNDPLQALPPMEEAGTMAPKMVVEGFEIKEGETTDRARERWAALSAAVLAQLDAAEAAAAGGRAPKGEAHLRARGRWFYEARVKKPAEPIMALARQNHIDAGHPGRFDDHDCRRQISLGIAEAEQLLNLGEYFFPHGGRIATP